MQESWHPKSVGQLLDGLACGFLFVGRVHTTLVNTIVQRPRHQLSGAHAYFRTVVNTVTQARSSFGLPGRYSIKTSARYPFALPAGCLTVSGSPSRICEPPWSPTLPFLGISSLVSQLFEFSAEWRPICTIRGALARFFVMKRFLNLFHTICHRAGQ